MATVAAKDAAEFSEWVSQLDTFKEDLVEDAGDGSQSHRTAFSSSKDYSLKTGVKPKKAAGEQLDQEMKLLRWHKLANDAALKSAIIKTKRLKAKDARARGEQKTADKLQWMKHIIREEQSRPLQVSRDYFKSYEKRMQKEDERVEQDIKRHVTSLKRVKTTMRQREELKRRNRLYRERKKEIADKIKMHGSENAARRARAGQPSADMLLDLAPQPTKGTNRNDGDAKKNAESRREPQTSKNLGKVLTSLDKLVELEKRIGELESGTRNPRRSTKRSAGASNGHVAFTKRSVASSGTKRTLYQVRVRSKKRSSNSTALSTLPRERKAEAKTQSRRRQEKSKQSTFITSLPDVSSRVGRSSSSALVPSTTRKRTSRRAHSRIMGRGMSKQDRVVKSYLRDRGRRRVPGREPQKKSSKPRRVSGKDHLAEFREARRQIDRKKRQLSRRVQALPDKEKQYMARHNLGGKTGSRTLKNRSSTKHRALVVKPSGSRRSRPSGAKRRLKPSGCTKRSQYTARGHSTRRRVSQGRNEPRLSVVGGAVQTHLPTINPRRS